MASTCRQSTPTWKYDVFLSFRGEDSGKSFCSHLYAALDQKGIFTFKDNHRLERGKVILSELFNAIEESMFSVVIISENYASSKWCLDELAKIIECMKEIGQTVLPIFYNVSPSEVRNQRGSFEKAFVEHEKMFGDRIERVQKWRDAMRDVGELSGWDLQNREESEVIGDIIDVISSNLNMLSASGKLVGMESRFQEIYSMLGMGSKDVRMIGICGMGGIGKTTLVKVVFDRISNQFNGSCFLANVREVSSARGLVALQEQLLSETLLEKNIRLWDAFRGGHAIRSRLRHKRVLVILDDVDQLEQLQALVGEHAWFHLGSRIIITTRDRHVLVGHGVDDIYMVNKLNDDDALQLFCWNAFRKDHPADGYLELSYSMVNYADGLPLALEVLGSFLFGRTKAEWENAVDRLKEVPDIKIFEILKISYYGLQELEQKIFLDCACFFKGKDEDRARQFFDNCNFYPTIGISVLIDKCLLTLANKKLCMHNLIQDMGREIVRQENPDQPGRRSRLWRSMDIRRVLSENEGTEVVEGIVPYFPGDEELSLLYKTFSRMKNLRLLKISGGSVCRIKYLSNELRLLKWSYCPLKSLPSNFQPENLYKLSMCDSQFQKLWLGAKNMNHLKIIKLSHSKRLRETPDFTGVPNLERLILDGCSDLSFLHPSVGLLKGLKLLNLSYCRNLKNFPTEIQWESLEVLILSRCSNLRNVEHIVGNAKHLLQLLLDGTSIQELPPSIQYLTRLTMLNLKNCGSLVHLSSNICDLRSLKLLNVNGCSTLDSVPENLWHMSSLEELDLGGVVMHKSFRIPSLSGLCSLRGLDLGDCHLQEGAIPNDMGRLSSLEILNLSGNDFVTLPESIIQLSKLETLNIEGCRMLVALPELPSSLNRLFAPNCRSLKSLSCPSSLTKSTSRLFDLRYCFRLTERGGNNSAPIFNNLLQSLLRSQLQGLERTAKSSEFDVVIPGRNIPEWFTYESVGSEISTILPIPFNSNLFRGLALCAVFSILPWSPKRDLFDREGDILDFQCVLRTEHNHEAGPVSISFDSESLDISTNLWLCYISQSYFSDNFLQDKSREITVKFIRSMDMCSGVIKATACGLRAVYSHDIEELIQAQRDD